MNPQITQILEKAHYPQILQIGQISLLERNLRADNKLTLSHFLPLSPSYSVDSAE